MKSLLEFLDDHSEEYDEDCTTHSGCYCRALGTTFTEEEFAPSHRAYTKHLEEVLNENFVITPKETT